MINILILAMSLYAYGNQSRPMYYVVECWSDKVHDYVQKASFRDYNKAVEFKNKQDNKDCRVLEQFE